MTWAIAELARKSPSVRRIKNRVMIWFPSIEFTNDQSSRFVAQGGSFDLTPARIPASDRNPFDPLLMLSLSVRVPLVLRTRMFKSLKRHPIASFLTDVFQIRRMKSVSNLVRALQLAKALNIDLICRAGQASTDLPNLLSGFGKSPT